MPSVIVISYIIRIVYSFKLYFSVVETELQPPKSKKAGTLCKVLIKTECNGLQIS